MKEEKKWLIYNKGYLNILQPHFSNSIFINKRGVAFFVNAQGLPNISHDEERATDQEQLLFLGLVLYDQTFDVVCGFSIRGSLLSEKFVVKLVHLCKKDIALNQPEAPYHEVRRHHVSGL